MKIFFVGVVSLLVLGTRAVSADDLCFRKDGTGSCLSAAQLKSEHGVKLVRFRPRGFASQAALTSWWLYAHAGSAPLDFRAEWNAGLVINYQSAQLHVCGELRAAGIPCNTNFMSGTWVSYNTMKPLYGVRLVFKEQAQNRGDFSMAFRCRRTEEGQEVQVDYQCGGKFFSFPEEQYFRNSFRVHISEKQCRPTVTAPLDPAAASLRACASELGYFPFPPGNEFVDRKFRIQNASLAADQELYQVIE